MRLEPTFRGDAFVRHAVSVRIEYPMGHVPPGAPSSSPARRASVEPAGAARSMSSDHQPLRAAACASVAQILRLSIPLSERTTNAPARKSPKISHKRFDSAESSDDLFEERAAVLLFGSRTHRTHAHSSAMFNSSPWTPNEAVIVSGYRGQRVVIGGCATFLARL